MATDLKDEYDELTRKYNVLESRIAKVDTDMVALQMENYKLNNKLENVDHEHEHNMTDMKYQFEEEKKNIKSGIQDTHEA